MVGPVGAARIRARLDATRGGPRRGMERVRARVVPIALTALAAGVAWELAQFVLPRPFFAPVSAVIALGVARGQHVRRAVELGFGVALGIGISDAAIQLVGTNGLTVAVVVVLAMSGALLFGGGQILVNQAAVSAVLLATLGTPPGSGIFDRFFAALIGGAVAVVVVVLLARDPIKQVGAAAEKLLDRLGDVLDGVAEALEGGDEATADDALELARSTSGEVELYEDELVTAREAVRLSPPRRRDLPRLDVYADAAEQVDYAVRNTRVLARQARSAASRGVPADPDLVRAVRLLAEAVRALGRDLRDPEAETGVRRLAREAAAEATAVLDRRQDLSSNVIVAQVRATAADLLRGSGMDTQELRVALGPYPGAQG